MRIVEIGNKEKKGRQRGAEDSRERSQGGAERREKEKKKGRGRGG